MYFAEGSRMRSRVIILLNALFDAGAITYWALWGIFELTPDNFSLANLITAYLILSMVVYGGGLYFWCVTKPEESESLDATFHLTASIQFLLALPDQQELANIESDTATSVNNEIVPNDEEDEPIIVGKTEDAAHSQSKYVTENVAPPEEAGNQSSNHTTPSLDNIPEDDYVLVRNRTQKQQLMSLSFGALLVFWAINVPYTNWIMTTTRDFLAYLGDDETGNKYLTIFTLLQPASLVAVPFSDITIHKIGFPGAFQAINGMGLVFSLIRLLSDNLNVQVVGFVIFSFWRSFLFGVCLSYLPTFLGPQVVGKASGIMFLFSGAAVFVNIPLSNYAIEDQNGDFFIPNLIYTCLIGVSFVAALFIGKSHHRDNAALEAKREANRARKLLAKKASTASTSVVKERP